MLYLASQFAWFLVAAFALGLVMGWLSYDGVDRRLWHPKLGYIAGAWALAAALTWTQTLNGVLALWVESALLFVAVYAAGCVLATLAAAALRPPVAPSTVTRVDESAPAGSAAKAPHRTGRPVSESVNALAKVEGEDSISGRRPIGFAAARANAPDDLKVIKGIGPENEDRLHQLGIWHFAQIAAWTPDNVEWVGSYLAFPGRIEREDWVEQAKVLAAEGHARVAKANGGASLESA